MNLKTGEGVPPLPDRVIKAAKEFHKFMAVRAILAGTSPRDDSATLCLVMQSHYDIMSLLPQPHRDEQRAFLIGILIGTLTDLWRQAQGDGVDVTRYIDLLKESGVPL